MLLYIFFILTTNANAEKAANKIKPSEKKEFKIADSQRLKLSDNIILQWKNNLDFTPIVKQKSGETIIRNKKKKPNIYLTSKKIKNDLSLKKVKENWKEYTAKVAKKNFRVSLGCKELKKKVYQCLRKGGDKKNGFYYETMIWVSKESFTELSFQSDKSLEEAESFYKKFKIL